MNQPLPEDADTDYTPTPEDLREIAEFLHRRSRDEAGAAGMMASYQKAGVTIEANIPTDAFASSHVKTVRQDTAGWVEQHSPDRFMELTGRLASLGDALASAGVNAISDTMHQPHVGSHRQQSIWRALLEASRLWHDHPDFKPLWAEESA